MKKIYYLVLMLVFVGMYFGLKGGFSSNVVSDLSAGDGVFDEGDLKCLYVTETGSNVVDEKTGGSCCALIKGFLECDFVKEDVVYGPDKLFVSGVKCYNPAGRSLSLYLTEDLYGYCEKEGYV
tara:strand:+ start:1803 stop:2171 length:369 start_codon:yes stop_codon:yes gene_type:complete